MGFLTSPLIALPDIFAHSVHPRHKRVYYKMAKAMAFAGRALIGNMSLIFVEEITQSGQYRIWCGLT